jgi:hypothetical protein
MTITINGTTGIAGVDGSAGTPAVQGADTNTGIFFPAADTIAFAEGGTEVMRINSSGNVGIGTTSQTQRLEVYNAATNSQCYAVVQNNRARNAAVLTKTTNGGFYTGTSIGTDTLCWQVYDETNGERARIDSSGRFLVGKTGDNDLPGALVYSSGSVYLVRDAGVPLLLNRLTDDGTLVQFFQATTLEGTISVSGTTVSYNGGHLSRWAQMLTKPDLLKGTVMSNLDEMNVYIAPTTYWTEEDELPEGVNVGDVKAETHAVDNEQLNKVKVSDVEGDVNVAGVFVNWTYDDAHQVDEINMAMTGDMIIRIAQGVVVQKGDLLMSAGDGTAKPQGDDIVRSKTVAKVTSNHVTCTYEDGSYCVPCVLMAC